MKPFEKIRQAYLPVLPLALRELSQVHLAASDAKCAVDSKVKPFFPLTADQLS